MTRDRTNAPAGAASRMACRIATAALLLGAAGAPGAAQTQPPAQPRPAQPQAQPQSPQGAPAQPQDLPVVYTPWTKLCTPVQNPPQAKPICVTVKEARLETGQFLAGAALVEQEGADRKLFRITLPLGMQIGPGTRVIIDQEQPLSSQYAICTQIGCLSEYQVNADFVKKLKGGRQMTVQGINMQGQAASYPMSLGAEFAKANEGPPTDPTTFEKTPPRR